jgi:hypothetical protein
VRGLLPCRQAGTCGRPTACRTEPPAAGSNQRFRRHQPGRSAAHHHCGGRPQKERHLREARALPVLRQRLAQSWTGRGAVGPPATPEKSPTARLEKPALTVLWIRSRL